MYVVTSNTTTGTAGTIPEALAVFAGQLRTMLPAGGVRWSVVDPPERSTPATSPSMDASISFNTLSASCVMTCTSSCTARRMATAASDSRRGHRKYRPLVYRGSDGPGWSGLHFSEHAAAPGK